jgi:hypothetical protein
MHGVVGEHERHVPCLHSLLDLGLAGDVRDALLQRVRQYIRWTKNLIEEATDYEWWARPPANAHDGCYGRVAVLRATQGLPAAFLAMR